MMSIEGTFQIPGRGTVATGTIDTGKIKPGEDVEIVGFSKLSKKTTCTGKKKINIYILIHINNSNINLIFNYVFRYRNLQQIS